MENIPKALVLIEAANKEAHLLKDNTKKYKYLQKTCRYFMRFDLLLTNEQYENFNIIDFTYIHHLPDDKEDDISRAITLERVMSRSVLSRTKTLLSRAKTMHNINTDKKKKEKEHSRISTYVKNRYIKEKLESVENKFQNMNFRERIDHLRKLVGGKEGRLESEDTDNDSTQLYSSIYLKKKPLQLQEYKDPYDHVGDVLEHAFLMLLPSRQEMSAFLNYAHKSTYSMADEKEDDDDLDFSDEENANNPEFEETDKRIETIVNTASTEDFAKALEEVLNDAFKMNESEEVVPKPIVRSVRKPVVRNAKNLRNFGILLASIGQVFQYGYIVKQDHIKAFTFYRAAERLGNASATFFIGIMYNLGYGVKQDYEQAFVCFDMAAKRKQPESLNAVGLCYQHGLGTRPNPAAALECFKLSAKLGNPDALHNLGYMYEYGHRFGIKRDTVVAQYFYQKADGEQKDEEILPEFSRNRRPSQQSG